MGGDLVSYFKNNPLFKEDEIKIFFYRILSALKVIHSNKIIHRDIKLDNILLDKEKNPVIIDFGISSVVSPGKLIKDTGGTPAYLAPEIILARGDVGYCSDIWSLGVLLYVLCFGLVPFKGEDIQELYRNIIKGEFEFPEFSYISNDLKFLIRRMLDTNVMTRIKIKEIFKNEWLKDIKIDEDKDNERKSYKNDLFIRYLNDFGFSIDQVKKDIEDNTVSHINACFINLCHSFTD